MADTLRLGFVDYFTGLDEFFIDVLSQKYQIIRDDVNPDYLIFCDETFGVKNREYDNRPGVTKIFYTGENRRPWNYQAHFAISFDHIDAENHFRLPLYVIDHWLMVNKLGMPHVSTVERNPHDGKVFYDASTKTKFCGFISGNGGSPQRNNIFHTLNAYRQVDAAGPLFNNIGYVLPRGLEAARNKAEWLKPYKFNICAENSSWPGYVTEKLFHAFYMKTIPIYWGSPTVAMDFNPKAFVNWHDYDRPSDFYDAIVALDCNVNKYIDMYTQPMFSTTKYMDTNRLLSWFTRHVYRHEGKV